MYQEQLAEITGTHLRSHIKAYLLDVGGDFSDGVPLLVPKRIEPASVVGGMISEFDSILPMYGIDVLGKTASQDDTALWSYEYAGQINGLVSSGSREAVDKLIKRHEAAVEMFIRDHRLMHQENNDRFSIIEFAFAGSDFSGAEDLGEHEGSQVWLAGFSINVSWFTSESGPDQHAS